MTGRLASRRLWVGVAVLAQVGILTVAVGDQLSARLTGEDYLLAVAPVDPVDPFRGAYVALSYPGLPATSSDGPTGSDGSAGSDGSDAADRSDTVYVPLVADGAVWRGGPPVPDRPEGPAVRCHDEGWRLRCGIESYFLPQAEAAEAGRSLTDGTAVAVVRVDSRGNAALVEVRRR